MSNPTDQEGTRVADTDQASLEELNRWLLESLDMVASLDATLHTDLELGKEPQAVFAAVKPVLKSLVDFRAMGFILVGENDLDFSLADCDPPTERALIQQELNKVIADGTFAWSLYQNRLVILPGKGGKDRVMLHVLATRFRVVGVFLAVLADESPMPLVAAQKLLSIILHNCAGTLENMVLYEKLKGHNQNLENIVEQRTRELREAKEAAEATGGGALPQRSQSAAATGTRRIRLPNIPKLPKAGQLNETACPS